MQNHIAAGTHATARLLAWPALLVWLVGALSLASCGGGGGGSSSGGGGSGGSGTTISVQPPQADRIVGQNLVLTASATGGGTASYAWESSSPGTNAWAPISGATGATLTVSAVSVSEDGMQYRVKVTTSTGTITSASVTLFVTWGSVVASADLGHLEDTYTGGGGGSDGGGDGGGADGGGGLGKTLNADFIVTRVADGALVGQALTHGTTGLVKIKAGPGAAPLLLTMRGNGNATYYDEGRAVLGLAPMVPFGPDQTLHALVDQITENLGVTPLTEAAYRYAINHYIVDPSAVASGAVTLRSTATAQELRSLTPQQIRQANQAILDEVNRKLPAGYRLDSLLSLPTPVDASSGQGATTSSRYGRMQAVTGGLVVAAGQFKSDLGTPALTVLSQLANDLTDGVLDGYALDGNPVVQDAGSTYESIRFPLALTVGANDQAARFSSLDLLARVERVTEVGLAMGLYSDGCPAFQDMITLAKDKTIQVKRQFIAPPSAPGQCSGMGVSSTDMPTFTTNVRQLYGNGTQAFVVGSTGQTQAWGNATCGMLGNGSSSGLVTDATTVPALARFTSFAVGLVSVAARGSDGRVYTFGSNVTGTLGLGDSPVTDTQCVPQYNVVGESGPLQARASNLSPKVISSLQNITSVHVMNQGRITFYAINANGQLFGWGSGFAAPFADSVRTSVNNGIPGFFSNPDRSTPAPVAGIDAVRAVASSGFSFFALRKDGTVWGWGTNNDATFGDGTATGKPVPARVPGLSGVREIVGDENGRTMYVLMADGSVVTWTGVNGRLGLNAGDWPALPIRTLAGLPKIRHMMGVAATTGSLRYMLAEDGRVFGVAYDVSTNTIRVEDWTPFF